MINNDKIINKQFWWIDNDNENLINYSNNHKSFDDSPQIRPNVLIKPVKQINKSELLKSWEQEKTTDYISLKNSNGSLIVDNMNDSVDIDDFMSKEIKLLSKQGYDLNFTSLLDKSIIRSDELSWLYHKDFNNQSNLSIESLSKPELMLDGSLELDIIKKEDNTVKSANNVEEAVEDLINKLKTDSKNLLNPNEFDIDANSSFTSITNQLDNHMSNFLNVINVKSEELDKKNVDPSHQMIENTDDNNSQCNLGDFHKIDSLDERVDEIRNFTNNIDSQIIDNRNDANIDGNINITTEHKKKSADKKFKLDNKIKSKVAFRDIDKEIDDFLYSNVQVDKNLNIKPLEEYMLHNPNNIANKHNYNNELNILNRAYDAELIAASEAFYKMKAYRQNISNRLNNLIRIDSYHPSELLDKYMSNHWIVPGESAKSKDDKRISLHDAKLRLDTSLSDTINRLNTRFPEPVIFPDSKPVYEIIDKIADSVIASNSSINNDLSINPTVIANNDNESKIQNNNAMFSKYIPKSSNFININRELDKLDSILGPDENTSENVNQLSNHTDSSKKIGKFNLPSHVLYKAEIESEIKRFQTYKSIYIPAPSAPVESMHNHENRMTMKESINYTYHDKQILLQQMRLKRMTMISNYNK